LDPVAQIQAFDYAHILALRVLDARIDLDRGRTDERVKRLAAAELPSLVLYARVLVTVDSAQVPRFVADLRAPGTHKKLTAQQLKESFGGESASNAPPDLAFKVVESYVRADPDVPVRARYNVACFYSFLTQHEKLSELDVQKAADRALDELDFALTDATLVPWAEADPSLRPLQKTDRWKKTTDRHRLNGEAPKPPDQPEPTLRQDLERLLDDVRRAMGL